MRLKNIVFLSALGYGTFKIIKHKDDIKENYHNKSHTIDAMAHNLEDIKKQLNTLTIESKQLKDMTANLNYKSRVFAKETQAHVSEINERINKYIKKED